MESKIKYDSETEIYSFLVSYLDDQVILEMISFVRQMKQMEAKCIILDFAEDLQNITQKTTTAERLSWSKSGQQLSRFISNSPVPVYGIARGDVFDEYFEILLACSSVFAIDNAKFRLCSDSSEKQYLTRFGTLRLLSEEGNQQAMNSPLFLGQLQKLANEYLKRKNLTLVSRASEFKVEIKAHLKELAKLTFYSHRLWSVNQSCSPLKITSYEYAEATIYANQPYNKILDKKIQTKKSSMINLDNLTLDNQKDDLANDYLNMSCYPDMEIQRINKKNRLAEVDLLLKQNLAPIKGKCVELGSGYGYFSALISKSPNVSEAVGLDISLTEIMQLGPFVWEKLDPDWEKLRFFIADMNAIDSEYGTYDTVIFCASLHHSSDIPLSLELANKLLKPGGSLIIHGEHVRPVYLSRKKLDKGLPQTILEFNAALSKAGFDPLILRYALPTLRVPYWLKNFVFTKLPFKYINGWFRFSDFMPLGIKK